jgi:hypothetical protein
VTDSVLNLFVLLLPLPRLMATPMALQLQHLSITLYKWAMVQHGSKEISYREGKSSFNPLQQDWLIYRTPTGTMTAGPSRLGSLPDPGPDERTPLDLLDEDYRPPEDYVPKYENTLTMSWDERNSMAEVKALRDAAKLSSDIAE